MENNDLEITLNTEQGTEDIREQNNNLEHKMPQDDFDSYGFYPDSGF